MMIQACDISMLDLKLHIKPEEQWSCSSPESINPQHSNIINSEANCRVLYAFGFNDFPFTSKFNAELVKKVKSLYKGQCQI